MKTRTLVYILILITVLIFAGSCATTSQRLRWSAESGDYAEVKRLIEEGADVNTQDQDLGWTALELASGKGHIEVVKLLIEEGANVNAQDQDGLGWTALISASYHGHPEIVKLLIDKGADVNAQDYYGYTALMYALEHGHTFGGRVWVEIARLLREAGAKEY